MSDQFKSDNLDVKVEHQKGCVVKLEVKAYPSLVKEAQKQAIKEVNKEVSIPGFRKGKAPAEMVLRQHMPKIEMVWRKKIADLSFVEAQKLVKIFPLNSRVTINFDLKSLSLEDGAELSFSFETEPDVPIVDPALFKMPSLPELKVEEEKVDETIRQAQFFYAKWTEVERPIQEGDYVIIDLEAIDHDPPLKVFSHTRFEIKDKSIAHWMKELLMGAKKGAVLEGISKPDADAPEEEKKKFEPRKVRVTVVTVEEAVLPELNDDFAKRLGAKDLADMKKNIKDTLAKQLQIQSDLTKKEEVNKFLLATYQFDLPASLIKAESKYRKDQMLIDQRFKKSWSTMKDEEKEKVEKAIQKQAEDAVTLFYLSRKIVNDANISITQKEIHDEIIRTVQESTPMGKEPNMKHISQEIYALSLSRTIMSKAQEYILSHSK